MTQAVERFGIQLPRARWEKPSKYERSRAPKAISWNAVLDRCCEKDGR
jgi:hypothetical protein